MDRSGQIVSERFAMAMTFPDHFSPGPALQDRSALVVDRHRLFAEVMSPYLADMHFEVTVATGADAATHVISARPPTLTLVDLSLPADDGLRLGRDVLASRPKAIVIGTMPTEDPRRVRETKEVGFWGCLSKELPLHHFTANIHAAIEGRSETSHWASVAHTSGTTHYAPPRDLLASQLTPRELEVLTMLVGGAGSAQIAHELEISWNTVRTHAQSILTKLQVHSRLEAAAVAVRQSLVPNPATTVSRWASAATAPPLRQP
jgi:DNA-binding NarL/FixJ family response regulator